MPDCQLTTFETNQLQRCEAVIEAGRQTFVEVGEALATIRDERLYRSSHPTFEAYCGDRWGFTRMRASQFINAAQTVQNLNVNNCLQIPKTESQARQLTRLEPDQQSEAWQQAVATAPNGKITAAHVESVVEQFNYKRDTKSARPVDIYVPQGYDACQTPPYAIDPLLPYLISSWHIWEPAAGEGYLEGAFYDAGFSVTASDLLTGQNFFEFEPPAWDCLITNPPFSIKYKWLEHCYELGKPFALLMPVEALGTESAAILFEKYYLEVIFVRPRINFKMPNKGWSGGGAQFPVAWYTWGLSIGRQITFVEVKPDDVNS